MYNELNNLNNHMQKIEKELVYDKVRLSVELKEVRQRLKPMGKIREFTAQRIDIKT